MLRVEGTAPVKSFTFIVDYTVKETPISECSRTKFKYSSLFGKDTGPEPLVARSSIKADSASIINLGDHSFVSSAITAYNEHLHLVVRPDDVWLAIMTQFSFYLNVRAVELRSKFVAFEGNEELVVTSYGTLHTAPYEMLTMMMAEQISANIKDPSIRAWVLPDFSTTSNTDRVVGACVLMATLKEHISWQFNLLCGLPKVTILGSVDDWKLIRTRVKRLVEFDVEHNYMKKWVDMLLPVIDNFISSSQSKPDIEWWNQIVYRDRENSEPAHISGWITMFTVFTDQGGWMGDQKTFQDKHETPWIYVNIHHLPSGYVSCPLKMTNTKSKNYDAEIYAGHIVSKLLNNNETIVPQLDWCILVREQNFTNSHLFTTDCEKTPL